MLNFNFEASPRELFITLIALSGSIKAFHEDTAPLVTLLTVCATVPVKACHAVTLQLGRRKPKLCDKSV